MTKITRRTALKDQIEEELLFIPEGGIPGIQVLTMDGQVLALELPQTVDMEIVDTSPASKGHPPVRAPNRRA